MEGTYFTDLNDRCYNKRTRDQCRNTAEYQMKTDAKYKAAKAKERIEHAQRTNRLITSYGSKRNKIQWENNNNINKLQEMSQMALRNTAIVL